jgi:hypothetical protein
MFGGIKYRSEVNAQICSILMLVPEVNSLVRPLKDSVSEFRNAKTPEMEAAVLLSLVLIENLVRHVPPDARLLTLQYLNEKKDDDFRWFARYGQASATNQQPERPEDMPNLTAALGFAFWYVLHALRENKLSERCFRTFSLDVVGMLQGKSRNERLADRAREQLAF